MESGDTVEQVRAAVDAVYRAHRLVIELDSRQFHATTRAFERDRDRDADLLNAGFSTLRITNHRLKHHPTKEAKRFREILANPSRTAPPHAA